MLKFVNSVIYRLKRLQTMQRINCGLARAAAIRSGQKVDARIPRTWEFSGLSQNGEDGITDFLLQHLKRSNRYFVEIGASDGTENNSSWLAIARRYRGLMVEGSLAKANYCRFIMGGLNIGVEVAGMFVSRENIQELYQRIECQDPDFFSIDIDSIDYYIVEALLQQGLKPKIIVVEYNSCFGPELAVTIPYTPHFDYRSAHPSHLYYGASIGAWKALLERHNYRFLTVESNGVNAFFVQPECFDEKLFDGLVTVGFEENFFQLTRFAANWEKQYALISHLPLVDILSNG